MTQVLTSTGTWTIEYNGENRPVRWTNAATGTVITMSFDSQGRRTEYKSVTNGAQNTWLRFLYDGYLCIQVLYSNSPYNTFKEFIWDPTEPVATRPLVFRYAPNNLNLFYAFDGNKNVSDVFYRLTSNGIGAHYDYAPFGAVTRTHSDSSASFDIVSLNPFRFSSEYYDSELDLVYYNYRHYSPSLGRFLSRDPIAEQGGLNLYAFIKNKFLFIELLGLKVETNLPDYGAIQIAQGVSKSWFEGEFRAVFDSARITLGKNKEFVITGPTPSMAVKYNEKIFKSVEEFKKSRTYTFHEKRHFDDFSRFYKLYAEDLNFYEGKKCPKCIENLKTYSRLLFSRLKMKLKKAEMVFHYDDYSVENLLREYNAIRTSDTPQIKRRYNEPNHIFYGRIYEAYESIINEKKEEIETIELEVVKAKEKLDECIKK